LYGGFSTGRLKGAKNEAGRETVQAMLTLIRNVWGSDNPVARNLFTTQFMPGAAKESMDAFNEIQRKATSAECAARYFETVANLDIRHLLPQVRTRRAFFIVETTMLCRLNWAWSWRRAFPARDFSAYPAATISYRTAIPR
jgi:hypothetical protein